MGYQENEISGKKLGVGCIIITLYICLIISVLHNFEGTHFFGFFAIIFSYVIPFLALSISKVMKRRREEKEIREKWREKLANDKLFNLAKLYVIKKDEVKAPNTPRPNFLHWLKKWLCDLGKNASKRHI